MNIDLEIQRVIDSMLATVGPQSETLSRRLNNLLAIQEAQTRGVNIENEIRALLRSQNFIDLQARYSTGQILEEFRSRPNDYLSLEYIDLLMSLGIDGRVEAANRAFILIRRIQASSLPTERKREIYNLLTLFTGHARATEVLQLLQADTPLPVAYGLPVDDSTNTIYDTAPMIVLLHYVLRERVPMIFIEQIAAILRRPISLLREKVYYLALAKHLKAVGTPNVSELEFLRQNSTFPVFKTRHDKILHLFPNEDITFQHTGCNNESGLVVGLDEVSPSLLYKDKIGNATYCFSTSELFYLLDTETIRHPYIGSDITPEQKRAYVSFLINRMNRGYPIMYSTAYDFYNPVPYNADAYDFTKRMELMLKRYRLVLYDGEINMITDSTGLSPFSLAGLAPLVRYYIDGNWDRSIRTSYPESAEEINRIANNR